MKNIKKIVAVMLAVMMMLALVGCNKKAADDNKLVVATSADFPPYEYVEGGEFVGIDMDIARAIADKLGMELEIQNVDFDSVIAGVTTGKYQMGMSGITANDERRQNVNFTDSYATTNQVIIVKEGSFIQSMDNFYTVDETGTTVTVPGLMVGVQASTTGDIYVSDSVENGGVGADHTTQFKTGADAIQALVTDKVQAVIIDSEPAKAFVAANPGLVILESPYVTEEYAIAVNKDNEELLAKVNGALQELIADGTVQQIVDKYIKA